MIKTIVVGTDGSAHGQHAVSFTADLARQLDAEVILVHVANPFPAPLATAAGFIPYVPQSVLDETRTATEKRVRVEFSMPLQLAGVKYQTRVIEGLAPAVLAKAATELDAQLIVVGTRALHAVGEFFLGSTSHALTHHAPVPVLVVPLTPAMDPTPQPADRVPAAV
jgi:nucleotide-binding universal stress UspA family protein